MWDCLVDVFGSSPAPRTNAHAKRNKAVADLRRLGATPESIRAAAKAFAKAYPAARLTDVALATHHDDLIAGDPATRLDPEPLLVAERWARGAGRQIAPGDRLDVMPYRDDLTDEQRQHVLALCDERVAA